MNKQELTDEILDGCYRELQKQIDEFYKMNGRLEKVKGRIEGRKKLAEFVVGIDLEIDTNIWDVEKSDINYYTEQLTYLREDILKGIEKVKIIEALKEK